MSTPDITPTVVLVHGAFVDASTAAWVKELVEHPGRVLAFDDTRHWSERTGEVACPS